MFLTGLVNDNRRVLGARGLDIARRAALYKVRERAESIIAERIADLIRKHLSRYT